MQVVIQPICIIISTYRGNTPMTQNIQVVPDDGTTSLMTHSELLGYTFWIDDNGVFMSAPSYATGGGCDMDNAIPVEDWESFSELTPDDLSHIFGYVLTL